MQTLILKTEEVEFLGATMRVTTSVTLVPLSEVIRKREEEWEKIITHVPTAKRIDYSQRPSLRGTDFTIRHPLTGQDEVFSHDVVLDAFPHTNFDDFVLEYESDVSWIGGASIMPDEYEAELVRRGVRPPRQ